MERDCSHGKPLAQENVEGKLVETWGFYRLDPDLTKALGKPNQFVLADGTWRLVRLEDQVGQIVTLRGYPESAAPTSGGPPTWYFSYRGTTVFVEQMLGWERWHKARPFLGVQLWFMARGFERWEADGKPYYTVKKASWEMLPESKLLALELPDEEENAPNRNDEGTRPAPGGQPGAPSLLRPSGTEPKR